MSHLSERLVKFLDRMPSPWPGFSLQEPVDTHVLSICLTFAINGPSLSQLCRGKLKKVSESNLCFILSGFKAVELVKVHCLQPGLGLKQAAPISFACPEENVI